MKILVVGGGGREHALTWALARSPRAPEIHAAPGNAGIAASAVCHSVAADDVESQVALARKLGVDLVVVGPEAPLCAGLADRLERAGIATFGPQAAAARIEGSKIFAKDLMMRAGVRTARAEFCSDAREAEAAVRRFGAPVVIKADGLAAGKGVTVAATEQEALAAIRRIMIAREFGGAGDRVLVEEYLEGEEASILALVDGKDFVTLAASQDHKRLRDGDRGPNTGGMGAYSPTPCVDEAIMREVETKILAPVLNRLADDGISYRGVLYAGLILTADGPSVLEFNCRFGDPETQAVLPRLETDLLELIEATVGGRLAETPVRWSSNHAVCVVMASGGYPGGYERGLPIEGIDEAEAAEGVVVFHAGTRVDERGRIVTAGGRVLGVTALGPALREARDRAYEAVEKIRFDKAVFRRDIGMRALRREE